jgi:hypothetical protein
LSVRFPANTDCIIHQLGLDDRQLIQECPHLVGPDLHLLDSGSRFARQQLELVYHDGSNNAGVLGRLGLRQQLQDFLDSQLRSLTEILE